MADAPNILNNLVTKNLLNNSVISPAYNPSITSDEGKDNWKKEKTCKICNKKFSKIKGPKKYCW